MLLGSALRQNAVRYPHREAILFEDRSWSFRVLNAEVNRLAHALAGLGVGTGDRVALSLSNRPELFTAYFAAQKIGAVAVLLNYNLTASELPVIGDDSGPKVWFCDERTAPAIDGARSRLASVRHWIHCGGGERFIGAVGYSDVLSGASDAEPTVPAVDTEAPSLVMYTSGTTGQPKGVMLSHRAQWINTILMIGELGFLASDRALQIAPLFHVAAFHVIGLPMMFVGGCNAIVEKYDPTRVAGWMERYRATGILGAPTHFELWSEGGGVLSEAARGQVRHAIITGAPARPDTIDWIQQRISPRLWDVYGQTEACSLISLVSPDQVHRMAAVNCIGRPLLGMDVALVPDQAPVLEGLALAAHERPERGELVSRGPKLMSGYQNLPEKTAETVEDGWLRTGDLVKMDEDGYYYYLGRVDDMIITGGENVYPVEIEEFLLTCPGVSDCVVVGQPDPTWGQVITAYVVPDDGRFDRAAVEELARQHLAPHKRPRRWHEIKEIPRSPSGKLLVRELRGL